MRSLVARSTPTRRFAARRFPSNAAPIFRTPRRARALDISLRLYVFSYGRATRRRAAARAEIGETIQSDRSTGGRAKCVSDEARSLIASADSLSFHPVLSFTVCPRCSRFNAEDRLAYDWRPHLNRLDQRLTRRWYFRLSTFERSRTAPTSHAS